MITVETIERIVGFDGGGLPVVSMYVGVDVDPGTRAVRTRVASLAHELKPMLENGSLAHAARVSLRSDIERIETAATQERWAPGTAAIFSCSGAGLYEEVLLPRAVRDRVVADATPWVRPMLAVLDEYHRACVVVVDRESAATWELFGGDMRPLSHVTDEVQRKRDYAGWHGLEERGVRNRAGELAKRHFRRVAGMVGDLCHRSGHDMVIVGGHREEVPRFMELLPNEVRSCVAGTFSVDPRTATVGTIRRCAGEIVERYERDEERAHVARVLDTAAAGGLAAVGLGRCLWAGSVAAIQELLVEEGTAAPGVVCERRHWLGRTGATCPVCGARARPTVDVLDELVEAVIDGGGAIEHVRAGTDLRELAVAAALRFPLPPEPGAPA
ncbi:MAG: peptide chain release factor subunit 1 [Solirubrobacteraceae bacterium]|jgi:peptide chain release factor subunit 1|nr:peptide chain release factor subunit 1 [Solirubrobacteraceae bacterium]